jgi:hypothetical protein
MNSIRSDLATCFRTRVGPGVFDISGSQLHTPEDRKVFRQRIGWATKKVEDGQGSNREGQGKNPGHQLQRADLEVHVTIARAQPSGTAEEVCVEEDVDAFDVEVLHSKWKNEHRPKYIFQSKYMKRVSLHTLACTPYVPS